MKVPKISMKREDATDPNGIRKRLEKIETRLTQLEKHVARLIEKSEDGKRNDNDG